MQFTGQKAEQPVQRVYWPENVIDWLGKWRPTCVMRHARGQKLQSFRHKWALLYGPIFILCSRHVSNALYGICVGQSINSTTAIIVLSNARFMNKHFFSSWTNYTSGSVHVFPVNWTEFGGDSSPKIMSVMYCNFIREISRAKNVKGNGINCVNKVYNEELEWSKHSVHSPFKCAVVITISLRFFTILASSFWLFRELNQAIKMVS